MVIDMAGIDVISGTELDELADIRQSVQIILTTPVGSRVMRRNFGSHLAALIDSPANGLGGMRVIAAAADAIARWENRVDLIAARLVPNINGQAELITELRVRASGLTITASAPVGLR